MRLGRDLCPHCRADVLRLPTDAGPQVFDPTQFAIDEVEPDDRYLVLAHRYVTKIDPGRPLPDICLRVHHCAEQDLTPPPLRPAATPPARADYAAARRLETLIELYRAQQLGTLRHHPGQRTYERVTVPVRLATIARLRADRCPLCQRQLDAEDQPITVGTVEADPPYPLRACRPACPTRGTEAPSPET